MKLTSRDMNRKVLMNDGSIGVLRRHNDFYTKRNQKAYRHETSFPVERFSVEIDDGDRCRRVAITDFGMAIGSHINLHIERFL